MARWPRSVRRKFGASSVHNLYIQQSCLQENYNYIFKIFTYLINKNNYIPTKMFSKRFRPSKYTQPHKMYSSVLKPIAAYFYALHEEIHLLMMQQVSLSPRLQQVRYY